ncbi:MAG: cation-translocating P-type ATPase [Candidatus Diapherotrites archaeon]|uniref:Cation-translocating P-type ATPase n=1 Tax=Candidatus Iainarchaeum sp. TaxID=3101447 RepID=A0A8T4LDQ8_9ARCH|nr:cation-translocating P-type ATPase [Candidatus Diapherotrites archaeon]
MTASQTDYSCLSAEDALKSLKTTEKGLSSEWAEVRLKEVGPNELAKKKKNLVLEILVEQFSDVMVLILLAAAILLFFVVNETLDAVVILAIVLLNALVGFIQEYKAENAIEAIKKLSAFSARVLRNGKVVNVNAAELVPGDIIFLEAGDKIPADGRILESFSLLVDESSLTGESTVVEKSSEPLLRPTDLADKKNMVFKQTIVANGKATVAVTNTGMTTEIGRIAGLLSEIESEETPLVKRLKKASVQIGIFITVVSAGLILIGLWQGKEAMELALVAISLAVAAVPEGLPAIITITLTIGATVMSKKKAIVRKIQAVETIGNCSVICSDKTGTLTKNEMTVTRVFSSSGEFVVSGSGFDVQGAFFSGTKKVSVEKEPELDWLLKAVVLANDATFSATEQRGDSTELALLVAAYKAGLKQDELSSRFEVFEQNPFNTERKAMSVQARQEGRHFVFVKGSGETILEKSDRIFVNGKEIALSEEWKKKMLFQNAEMASLGLRVLGVGMIESKSPVPKEKMEENVVFLGLVGMIDAARPEAKESIAKCHHAGIEVKMITGDHPLTALAVGKELGLCQRPEDVITGSELDCLSGKLLEDAILNKRIFARVNPEHKMVIVQVLQKKGFVVGMTGDGINDGPALKQADVGFAMGITGTDVAKESAQIVLADDNFATIVTGIEEGRRIYSNIRGFMKYLFAANLGEILIISLAILLDFRFLPLVAIQILWLNLATDGLPALALGAEKGDQDVMDKKPRRPTEGLLHGLESFILVAGVISAIMVLGVFSWGINEGLSLEKARTLAFNMLVLFELVLVFNCRSEEKTMLEKPFWTNRKLMVAVVASGLLQVMITQIDWFHPIFETTDLAVAEWIGLGLLSFSAIVVPYLARGLNGWISKFRPERSG